MNTINSSTGSDQLALAKLMDFGVVVRIDSLGTPIPVDSNASTASGFGLYVEEVQYVDLDADGRVTDEPNGPEGWEYLTFLTGQHGVGPTAIMAPANVITGGIAEHILSRPGYYVAVMIDGYLPDGTADQDGTIGPDIDSVGWGVLHYIGGDK